MSNLPASARSYCLHAPMMRRSYLSRRQVLRTAAAGLTLMTAPVLPFPAAAEHAGVLLLSCMDYRLLDDIVRYMDGRKLTNGYDQITLAGASLGATTSVYPAWGQTFWAHLQLALDLHRIEKLIILDHRDCGVYRLIFGHDYAADPTRETEIHTLQLRELRAAVDERYPNLPVELLLMSLDGSVEPVVG